MYIKRALENTIKNTYGSFRVLLINGPRQVGKTTLLMKLNDGKRQYVTLDDPFARGLAVSDPAMFMERYPPPVIIDEIQYAPQILPYIKMHVDTHQNRGDFWLTGSQQFHLMKGVTESLAGRVGIIDMLGLSNSELLGIPSEPFDTEPDRLSKRLKQAIPQNVKEIFERIIKGGMPELYVNNLNTETFYSSYMQTYLQRDIKDLLKIGDELTFVKFMSSVAARTSQMLNYNELAKDAGISAPTAKQWFSILVTSGLVAVISPYHANTLKRIIKTPKFYFLDTGLCAYLTRWLTPETLEAGAMSGAFFETWVVSEIIKSYYNAGRRPPLYYYRDKEQREIDLIIHENGTLYPIEIKKTGTPDKSDIRHFGVLKDSGQKLGTGCVVCMIKTLMPVDKNNWFVPAWMI